MAEVDYGWDWGQGLASDAHLATALLLKETVSGHISANTHDFASF